MLVDYCLNVFLRMMQIRSSTSFMKENLEATSTASKILKKSLELVIIGPPSFKISIEWSSPVTNVKSLKAKENCFPYLWNQSLLKLLFSSGDLTS